MLKYFCDSSWWNCKALRGMVYIFLCQLSTIWLMMLLLFSKPSCSGAAELKSCMITLAKVCVFMVSSFCWIDIKNIGFVQSKETSATSKVYVKIRLGLIGHYFSFYYSCTALYTLFQKCCVLTHGIPTLVYGSSRRRIYILINLAKTHWITRKVSLIRRLESAGRILLSLFVIFFPLYLGFFSFL